MAGKDKFVLDTVFRAIDRITAPVRRIQGGMRRLGQTAERVFSRVNKSMAKAHQGLKTAGKWITGTAVVGGAALWKLGQAGASFEEAITAVGAVGLQTRDQIADLEKEALRLGSTTQFTATQAANAMEIMARAGFSNAEIMSGVGGVLDAAAASGLEMAEVANHVSNVMKGMGLEAAEAGRVADVLTVASSATNSSIGSLGESMKNLSPVAKQFGVSLEDAVGMVALLQDVGLDASEAGTATSTMLTKLATPTDAIAKQMKKLGITFQDSYGNMLPPLEIFAQMQEAAGKLGGNMEQVAFFSELVGLRGQKAALNLKELFTSDKGQRLTRALDKALGSSREMSELRADNFRGDIEKLSSAVEGLQIKLFETQSGPLRDLVQGMTEWVSANEKLIVSKFTEWMKDVHRIGRAIADNWDEITTWAKRLAYAVVVFYGIRAAVKAAMVMTAIYNGVVATATFLHGLYSAAALASSMAGLTFAGVLKAIALAALPALKVLGLVGAAILAIAAAIDQLLKLVDEVGGWGGLWAGAKSLLTEGSFFAGVDEHMNEQARKRAKAEAARAKATEHIAPEIGAIGTESFMKGILDQIPALEKDLGGVGEIGGSAFTQSIIDTMPGLQAELDRLNVPRIVIEHQAVGGSDPGVAQMVSDRSVMHDIRESIQTTESRLTIEDQSGRAKLETPKRSGITLRQSAPSGAM